MATTSKRLSPLLAQLDTTLELASARMRDMTDAECEWHPDASAVAVTVTADGKRRVTRPTEDVPRTRTIGLLIGHLGEMAVLRSDYANGTHAMSPDDIELPVTAADGLTFVQQAWSQWRDTLASLADHELDIVGRCDFPWGRDPDVTALDVTRWMNRELIHHTAEIAFVRDLYANRHARDTAR
jgi:hypothetical protein